MKTIAFFDFDGTITENDTFITFGLFSLGRMVFAKKILRASPWLFLWKMRIISNSKAKETLFAFMFKGMSKDKFTQLCQDFKSVIDNNLKSSTISYLKRHQKQGHQVVIVSASIINWIEPWAKSYGIKDVIATKIEFDINNKLTGRFLTPNCHGSEKANKIHELFGDISSLNTFAYGDSKGDNAMLSLVKHPVKI